MFFNFRTENYSAQVAQVQFA